MNDVKCPICGTKSKYIFHGTVLTKYKAEYYQCSRCGFVFINSPFWTEEAYSSPITVFDTGIINRNVTMAQNVSILLKILFGKRKIKCLDFGGGYGIFTRMMRDQGYNFGWYDKYSDCMMARGYESNINKKYDCVTAFEVFEHLTDPSSDIKTMVEMADTVIFSTELYDKGLRYPNPEEWWYYLPEAGQHVSFYSKKTLETIAKNYGINYFMINNGLHVLSKYDFSFKMKICKFLLNTKVGHLYRCVLWEIGRCGGYAEADMSALLKNANENSIKGRE